MASIVMSILASSLIQIFAPQKTGVKRMSASSIRSIF